MKKKLLFVLVIFVALFNFLNKARAQSSELGFSFILSGHLMFGPYYRYWIDDRNNIETCILAAYEERFLFPAGLNIGYHYHFFEKHWRPSLGAQYTLLVSPKIAGENNKRKFFSLFSVVPGVQFRWTDNKYSVEERIWISYFKFKNKNRVFPTGLESRFGIK